MWWRTDFHNGSRRRSGQQSRGIASFRATVPVLGLKPLPLAFGRRRCRTGFVARRSAEDLAPVRLFEDIVRTIALEHTGWSPRRCRARCVGLSVSLPGACPERVAGCTKSGSVKARGEAVSSQALLGDAAEFPHVGCDAFVDHVFLRRFGLKLASE